MASVHTPYRAMISARWTSMWRMKSMSCRISSIQRNPCSPMSGTKRAGASVIQERTHAYALKSTLLLLDPRGPGFFDAFVLGDGDIAFVLGDVTGDQVLADLRGDLLAEMGGQRPVPAAGALGEAVFDINGDNQLTSVDIAGGIKIGASFKAIDATTREGSRVRRRLDMLLPDSPDGFGRPTEREREGIQTLLDKVPGLTKKPQITGVVSARLEAIEAPDDETARRFLAKHAADVVAHVDGEGFLATEHHVAVDQGDGAARRARPSALALSGQGNRHPSVARHRRPRRGQGRHADRQTRHLRWPRQSAGLCR